MSIQQTLVALVLFQSCDERFDPRFFCLPIGLFSLPEFLCDLAVKFVGVGSFTSLPFGDGQGTTGMDTDANHYAMLDHDTETDTDYAQFRQYSNTQGRWLSPDPYHGSYNWRNPQSFNRYAYVGNNPLASVDPSGLMTCNNYSCIYGNGNDGVFGEPLVPYTTFYDVVITAPDGRQIVLPAAAYLAYVNDQTGYGAGLSVDPITGELFSDVAGDTGYSLMRYEFEIPSSWSNYGDNTPYTPVLMAMDQGSGFETPWKPSSHSQSNRVQPFSKCVKNGMNAGSLGTGFQAGTILLATVQVVSPNPYSKASGIVNALVNFGTLVSTSLVCSDPDVEIDPGS